MIISKENVMLNSNLKYFKVGSIINKNEHSVFNVFSIKTSLFPTIKLSESFSTICPNIYNRDGKNFLKNEYKKISEIEDNEHILVPKLKYEKVIYINKEYAWLYGKFIANGYFKKSKYGVQIIIPVKRISKEEEKKILKIEKIKVLNCHSDNFYKQIIIDNEEIKLLFKQDNNSKKNLNNFIINSDKHIYNYFLRSLLEEKDKDNFIKIDSLSLAHEIFIHSYSKCNKVLKIIFLKKQNNYNKEYYITLADKDEYVLIGENLYNIVIQKRKNNNSLGFSLEDMDDVYYNKNKYICNSIYIKK